MRRKLRGPPHKVKPRGGVRWAWEAGWGARGSETSEVECNTAATADANINLLGGFSSLYLGGIEVSMGLRFVPFECSKESQLRKLELENPKRSYYVGNTSNSTNIDPCTKPVGIGRAVSRLGKSFQRHSSLAKRTDAL